METVDAHVSTPVKGLDKGLLKTRAGGDRGHGVIAQTNPLEISVKAQDKTGSHKSMCTAMSEHEPANSNVDEKVGNKVLKEHLENAGTLIKVFVIKI
jgi:hypothetical protein